MADHIRLKSWKLDETTATPFKIAPRHPACSGRWRLFGALIATAMVLLALATSHSRPNLAPDAAAMSQPATEAAFFQFDYPPYQERFIFELTDPAKIQEARDILSGQRPSRHIMGTIVKTPADYNPPWSYHLDPASVVFFNSAIEVCDATIQYVEDHLVQVGGTILPDYTWCPWGSRLIAEVPESATPTATVTATATPTMHATPTPTAPPSTATATPTQLPTSEVFLPIVLRD